MISHLSEMAEFHGGGKVSLHDRLFAQWMHHACPQECPFIHGVRGLSTLNPVEWSAQTGLEDSLCWTFTRVLVKCMIQAKRRPS